MNYVLLLLALACCSCYAKKFPAGWVTCKMNDPKHNECLRDAIQKTLPDLIKGMPKFGMGSVDPLKFNRITIKQGSGAINLDLVMDDVDLIGIRNGIVQSVTNDWKRLIANVTVPKVTAVAKHYKMDGKMLILPIRGEGKAKLVLDNFRGAVIIDFEEETKGGKKYYKVKKFTMDLDCDTFHQEYENLFEGNKQLAEQMKIFMEENQKELFKELRVPLAEAVSGGLQQLSNRLFSKIPKDEITPP